MTFVDAHLHMTDPGFSGYDDIEKASYLFSCTASPSEWDGLAEMSADARIIPFYGVHPWNVHEYEGHDRLRDILLSNPKACMGEIGMDGTRGNMDLQRNIFKEQLKLASELGRPVSVHMVKAEKDVLNIIGSIDSTAIIHSFSGPESYVRAFTKAGCFFSISPRIMTRSEFRIKRLLDVIPSERLLLETDAPNIQGYTKMRPFVEDIAKIMSMPADDLETLTEENAIGLIP